MGFPVAQSTTSDSWVQCQSSRAVLKAAQLDNRLAAALQGCWFSLCRFWLCTKKCAAPAAEAADCRIHKFSCTTPLHHRGRTEYLLGQLVKRLAVQLASLLGSQQQELQSWTAELALSKGLIEVQRFCLQPLG